MTHYDLFATVLETAQDAYCSNPEMLRFLPFPGDVTAQPMTPYHRPCSDAFRDDTVLRSTSFGPLETAIRVAGPVAHWRETYKDTGIGDTFLDQFGCYCIIGENGPFTSEKIRLYMVYMPPGLYYPWHHHPAEEIYMVIAGNAVFRRKGMPDATLREGDTSFHKSNQPHAMETTRDPILCLVAWRNAFDTRPVLTR